MYAPLGWLIGFSQNTDACRKRAHPNGLQYQKPLKESFILPTAHLPNSGQWSILGGEFPPAVDTALLTRRQSRNTRYGVDVLSHLAQLLDITIYDKSKTN